MGKNHKEKGRISLFSAGGYDFDDPPELNQFGFRPTWMTSTLTKIIRISLSPKRN